MNAPTDTKLTNRADGLLMIRRILVQSSKNTPVVVATISVAVAILTVWVRWTYWGPDADGCGCSVPKNNIPLILAGLFTASIFVGFGAAIPKSRFWRRFLQGAAGLLLLAFVALPVDRRWVESAYYLVMPRPVIHRSFPGPIPGKPREERLVRLRAKPTIERRGTSSSDKEGYEMLVLRPAEGEPVEVVCGPTFSPWYSTLPRDRELTFTVWQTKDVSWHTDDGKEEGVSWDNGLETIQDGAHVLYDARVCPLHKVRMERVEAPISYGLPSKEYMDASEGFYGGPGFVEGGCVDYGKKTEMSYRCSGCVAAYAKWEAAFLAKRKKQLQDTEPKPSS